LKKNYERYLLEYEYKRFPQNRTKGSESNDKQSAHKRTSSGEFESSPTPEKKQKLENKTRKPRRKPLKEVTIPKLPIVIGDLVVESLGTIIPRPPYISDKHIWPIGFVR
jgi:hypothetical protein